MLQVVLGHDANIIAYRFTDLIAEKLRAVIQQVDRNRTRRQDIYDLFLLLDYFPNIDKEEKTNILNSLKIKAKPRNVHVEKLSLRNEEIKTRSAADYPKLADEIDGDLPDFDLIYVAVQEFYESLPW